ncbi:MAG: diacylglycerol kinase family protein [Actinomycetota bacterium]|nr:diacylglycerol kinase family protein [Actinomycetota bacterium]
MSSLNVGADRRRFGLLHILFCSAGLALVAAFILSSGSGSRWCMFLPFSFTGIAVLTNVEAGKNRFGRYKRYGIPEIVGDDGLVIETETMEEIDGAIERILSRGEHLICLNGGDGTVQRALTSIMNACGEREDELPVFFPLRGGTMNLLADNLGIKGKAPQLLREAMKTAAFSEELPYVEIPTLRVVREMAGGTEREYGFFFGSGALYRFHRVYYRDTKGGTLPAVKLVLRCLGEGMVKRGRYRGIFGMTDLRVSMDDFQMPRESFIIVLAMVFKKMLLTFNPFRDEGEGDFFTLAMGLPLGKIFTNLHKLFWVRGDEPPFPPDAYYNRRASRLKLRSGEGYSLDGEIFELNEPFDITIDLGPSVKILDIS